LAWISSSGPAAMSVRTRIQSKSLGCESIDPPITVLKSTLQSFGIVMDEMSELMPIELCELSQEVPEVMLFVFNRMFFIL
jgi:hypothetical protein